MNNQVYWLGQDGNIWLKGANGVQNVGKPFNGDASLQSGGFDSTMMSAQANRIDDPALRNVAGASNTVGSGGAAGGSKVDPNFVNQAFDTKIAGLQSVMDTLNPQQDSANLNVQNQFQNQSNSLQSQKAIGDRNLQMAGDQIQQSKVKSLDDLRRQVETQGRSYQNQLGAYGAGDSSASGMINQALSGMASRNRGDVMTNASGQQRAVDLQTQDLSTEFDNNMKSLDDWKNASLNDIATKFLSQRQQIQQAMIGANADRYQALAQADASYTNQAIQQLAALEGQYHQSASDLVGQYQNFKGPQVQIAPGLQQFQVNPIDAGKIGQIGGVPQLQGTGANPTPFNLRKPFEQDFGLNLGF